MNKILLRTYLNHMTYVVTENCIRCRYTDCVEVCPVDCFHAGDVMLATNPGECIDCGVCEPECPAGAIVQDVDLEGLFWKQLNKRYASKWPKLLRKRGSVSRC